MTNTSLFTPVLFLIFNRLETTKQVFEVIRLAQPPRLYIAADGPRLSRAEERDKVQAVRDYVLSNVDWDCEIKTLIREQNLGCRVAVSTAIDWFFEHEESGIILEDDTVPEQSFFQFCQELLQYYKDDERIMSIVAPNIQGNLELEHSYFFSRYSLFWGWATWRRAWQKYDRYMSLWPKLRDSNWLLTVGDGNSLFQKYWTHKFDQVHSKAIDSWGFVWMFSCWSQHGLSILPKKNLVSNIGYGSDATHTKTKDKILYNLRKTSMDFPLVHPTSVNRIYDTENYIDSNWFKISQVNYFKQRCRALLNTIHKGWFPNE